MNKFSKYISSQFKNPRGIGGVIISIIQNVINKAMYKRANVIQIKFFMMKTVYHTLSCIENTVQLRNAGFIKWTKAQKIGV